MVAFAYIPTNSNVWGNSPKPPYYLEDTIDGLVQLYNNPVLMVAFISNILAISIFNGTGTAITQQSNSTTRVILDPIRIMIVWVFSLGLQWQSFNYLQVSCGSLCKKLKMIISPLKVQSPALCISAHWIWGTCFWTVHLP